MDPTFGRNYKGELNSIVDNIINLLSKVPDEGVPSTVAQSMLIEEYETFYNIYNHDDDNMSNSDGTGKLPMPLIGKHLREDSKSFNTLIDRIDQFIDLRVHHYTGLNLTEFLDLPRSLSRTIRLSCENRSKREANVGDDFRRQLEQLKGRQGDKI